MPVPVPLAFLLLPLVLRFILDVILLDVFSLDLFVDLFLRQDLLLIGPIAFVSLFLFLLLGRLFVPDIDD